MTESPLRPPVHPFVECPNCRQLVEFGAEQCSRCREPIDPDYAVASAVIVHHNTQACTVANAISGFNAFIPLALIGSILIFVIDLYVSGRPIIFLFLPIWPLIPLLTIIGWFFRFGRFKIGDDEFLNAKREMRRSFLFWTVVLVVQILAIAAWRFRAGGTQRHAPDPNQRVSHARLAAAGIGCGRVMPSVRRLVGCNRQIMKGIFRILCIAAFSLTFANAQTLEDGKAEYLKWKRQVSTTLQDYNHLYTFQIAIALKRTDDTHIRILLAVVGRTPNHYFILQPVHALQFFDADAETDKTGKPDEWGSGQDTTVPRLGYLLEFDKTIECEQNTNAVFVSIKPVPNTGQPVETTVLRMIVPLSEKWHFEKRDFFVPRATPSDAPPTMSLVRSGGRVKRMKDEGGKMNGSAMPGQL